MLAAKVAILVDTLAAQGCQFEISIFDECNGVESGISVLLNLFDPDEGLIVVAKGLSATDLLIKFQVIASHDEPSITLLGQH